MDKANLIISIIIVLCIATAVAAYGIINNQDAIFSDHDIPFCPTTAKEIPSKIITFEEAKEICDKDPALENEENASLKKEVARLFSNISMN